MKTPEQRIAVIEQSLHCFVNGLWSFVPLVGIVPAVKAIVSYRRARLAVGDDWNPASRYLTWGMILGSVNLLLEVIVITVVASVIMVRML